ncbi:hypothetical protein PHMEG_0006390 [Phytophthora megakarya]|uniref:Uncharacterized protein n=1 Tax=Phytophthora megakarya TaxID=4795 RepID=A0A225WNX8_9STRA|nr:hypothetical protein PHMEG_0006390 [Phytophthora megakarya]
MTATNKAFAYVFNPASEDQNVSRVSEWLGFQYKASSSNTVMVRLSNSGTCFFNPVFALKIPVGVEFGIADQGNKKELEAAEESDEKYCDEVLRYGNEAEAQLIKFFESHGIKSKNSSYVLQQLRKFYREGKLDALISAYRVRVANKNVRDPAPTNTPELFSHT